MSDWRIRHDDDAALAAPRQKVPLNSAMLQIVENLVGHDLVTARQCERFLNIVDVKVAHAIIENFSGASQCLKRFNRFNQGNGAAPMQQITIEIVRLQTAEASFASLDRA